MSQILAAASRRRVTEKDGVSRARLFLIALGPPRARRPYEFRNLVQSKHKCINVGLDFSNERLTANCSTAGLQGL